eukprot:TRINITY_DN141733_c0_g1_i1.p1 TRINITY_DN141733_c0_g1~~TRINITY_DN141733_c0_g1_i1.p1  ORF type:complete len:123 (+),score=43.59 TRINITY_DN141733_c0_g1_i1:29-370(+)
MNMTTNPYLTAYTSEVAKQATGVITIVGQSAHKVIDAYRDVGERLLKGAEQRWNRALKASSAELTAETRKNATHAQKVFSGYCAKGLAMTADGATVVVDTLVGAALNTTCKAA